MSSKLLDALTEKGIHGYIKRSSIGFRPGAYDVFLDVDDFGAPGRVHGLGRAGWGWGGGGGVGGGGGGMLTGFRCTHGSRSWPRPKIKKCCLSRIVNRRAMRRLNHPNGFFYAHALNDELDEGGLKKGRNVSN